METDTPLASLRELEGRLVDAGWLVNATTRGLMVAGPEDPKPILVEIVWNAEHGLVYFRVPFAVQIPDQKRAEAAKKIAALNADLAIGGFQLRTGVIFEWATFVAPDGKIPGHIAQQGLELCRATAERYREPIRGLS